jgi:hypothetical protein
MSAWDALYFMSYLGIMPVLPTTLANLLGVIWVPAILTSTILAYRKLGFETDSGLVQSMLVVTLSFLIFKSRVTEQYAIYLLALAVIDVALWNPQRKTILSATVVTASVYLFLNNYFLVRFLSPIYPGFLQFELGLVQVEPVRAALLFVTGTMFTCLNIDYLLTIMKGR